MDFSSDTSAPAHPSVIEAISRANEGMAPSYGGDALTAELRGLVSDVFETEVDILPVISGTAANALSLSLLCRPGEAILCQREAHIERDERGAPEFYTGGGKLHLVDGANGKMDAERVRDVCASIDRKFFHETPAAAISLTNLTESGTAYSVNEMKSLTSVAAEAGLGIHLDGARFGNALAGLSVTPAEASWKAGVDVLSFGLTKTGAAGCEIICLFGEMRERFPQLQAYAKRGGHMPPKMRFLAAQGGAMLKDGLWLELACNANHLAQNLSELLQKKLDGELVYPVDGNEVFIRLTSEAQAELLAKGVKAYPWPGGSLRFVCHWNSMAQLEALSFAL